MLAKGWYDPVAGIYARSCGRPHCPVCGIDVLRRRYRRMVAAFPLTWPFRSYIVHFNGVRLPDEIADAVRDLRTAVTRFDRHAVLGVVVHPLRDRWHLHVGVASLRLNPGGNLSPKGRARKWTLAGTLRSFCMTRGNKKDAIRLVRGKYRDAGGWLWYCLRCGKGFPEEERFPGGCRYRLHFGMTCRKPR